MASVNNLGVGIIVFFLLISTHHNKLCNLFAPVFIPVDSLFYLGRYSKNFKGFFGWFIKLNIFPIP